MQQLEIQITDRDLPVLSVVATQALELLRDPNVTNKGMEELIRLDPALTQRVLRTANSPFYCGRRQSASISEAILRLGLRQLRNIIIVAATGEIFNAADPFVTAFWDHAIISAMTANRLADLLHVSNVEEAFIAGMLHDVGRFIIYSQHPDVYRNVLEESASNGIQLSQVETAWFRFFTHTSVGGLVIRKWQLSDSIAEAARFHHDLDDEIPSMLEYPNLVCLIALANMVVSHLGYIVPVCPWEAIPERACARQLHFTTRHQDGLLETIQQEFEAQRSAFH